MTPTEHQTQVTSALLQGREPFLWPFLVPERETEQRRVSIPRAVTPRRNTMNGMMKNEILPAFDSTMHELIMEEGKRQEGQYCSFLQNILHHTSQIPVSSLVVNCETFVKL